MKFVSVGLVLAMRSEIFHRFNPLSFPRNVHLYPLSRVQLTVCSKLEFFYVGSSVLGIGFDGYYNSILDLRKLGACSRGYHHILLDHTEVGEALYDSLSLFINLFLIVLFQPCFLFLCSPAPNLMAWHLVSCHSSSFIAIFTHDKLKYSGTHMGVT